ncbi:hypothetical protein Acy02nite_80540 [Actinoplanes cyaneus]|uniref:PatA-like N-terminal domain-containing protein n=1 Tax=Actinoplanes cyaneus TaxID=52696 RepID=A0A919IRL9_9ACTN|nr:DUF4388 domain-containing protein [Actinoplanes cyaneus]MCW2143323.1 hypothetical protein [Actinoplanes cyaneus]GID70173.1 hypothetical protein Acy02nite_80540 [Actinoplanes cyaneus]
MAATKTAAPGDLLSQVAEGRQTGALVVGGHPGGAVYVFEGRVIYAESPAAPGVGELLTSSGRLAGRTWQNALDLGTSTARVGRLLVEQGHLTQGELELCVLGATYDAAYFVLTSGAVPVDFLPAATHWLGAVVHIDTVAVLREVRRRVTLLDDIFPNPRIDTHPVSPVARPPRERVTVTALQWELLIHADGQRTPADLALLLGRAGYATIQELRRLAALGLIELPAARAPDGPDFVRLPQHRAEAAPVTRPAPPPPVEETAAVPVISGPPPPLPPPAPPPSPPGEGNTGPNRLPRLARRKPGAKLPKELATENPPVHQGTDEVLLKRIRTALRALR